MPVGVENIPLRISRVERACSSKNDLGVQSPPESSNLGIITNDAIIIRVADSNEDYNKAEKVKKAQNTFLKKLRKYLCVSKLLKYIPKCYDMYMEPKFYEIGITLSKFLVDVYDLIMTLLYKDKAGKTSQPWKWMTWCFCGLRVLNGFCEGYHIYINRPQWCKICIKVCEILIDVLDLIKMWLSNPQAKHAQKVENAMKGCSCLINVPKMIFICCEMYICGTTWPQLCIKLIEIWSDVDDIVAMWECNQNEKDTSIRIIRKLCVSVLKIFKIFCELYEFCINPEKLHEICITMTEIGSDVDDILKIWE